MTPQQPKRKVGRPSIPGRAEQRKARRVLSVDKTPRFMALLNQAHDVYKLRHGKPGAHSKVIAEALALYLSVNALPDGQ